MDSDWHLLGDVPGARQPDGESGGRTRDVASNGHVYVRRQEAAQLALVLDGY